MNLDNVKKLKIPTKPGSYQFYDKKGKIIYIGKAANLKSRVLSYWQKSANHSPAKYSMMKQIEKIKWIETDTEIEALLLEANLIKKYKPPFNITMRDDKRYIYLKISLEDEVPGLFITRKIDRSGKYFGPFTSAYAVKETLKAIRKIWPYCNERKTKNKPCFYYQIGKCTGVCANIISRKEYLDKVIKSIIMFFEGKKNKLIKNYDLIIKKEKDEDIKNKLKYELANMKHVLEHTNVIGLMDKYASDVVEIAKILGLSKVPLRIEGYDISNIFGREAVGSMVVFSEGEPDKNEYRKFKIKILEEKGDVGMLKEVIERRFKNEWAMPDLIIVDGGKGQLNAALSVLKKIKFDIPAISVSKGEGLRSSIAPDKIFFPGEKNPLILPLSSPAMHLIKRVRDEAHRFAIKYHRELRRKNFTR